MGELKSFESIEEYIQSFPVPVQKALRELKDCVLKAAPDAEETFNYNIPAFTLIKGGKRDQQIMIAGYPKHVGLYPHPTVMKQFADELIEYKTGKGSVQFPLDRPIPMDLVVKMVKYRLNMLKSK